MFYLLLLLLLLLVVVVVVVVVCVYFMECDVIDTRQVTRSPNFVIISSNNF